MNVVYVVGGEGWSHPSWVGKAGVSTEGVVVVEFTPLGGTEVGAEEEEGDGKRSASRHEVVIGRKLSLWNTLSYSNS